MNVPELEAFVASVETGSVSQAARRLNRVQSTISLRISNLEDRLGVSLFERKHDGLSPTQHGTILYRYAVDILKLVREAINSIECFQPNDTVRVGFMEIIPSQSIDRIIEISEISGVRLNIKIASNDDILELMESDDLDIAVVASGFVSRDFISTPLYCEKLVLVSSSSLEEIGSLEEISRHPFYVHSKKKRFPA